jgi:hypothetical protein
MSNLYYHPETYGLTVVADVQAAWGYDFDTFVIWQDRHGTYWWGYDAGCSCPLPFENRDLSNLPSGNLQDAITDLKAWMQDENYNDRARKGMPVLDELTKMSAEKP